jgi:hypothetical protein
LGDITDELGHNEHIEVFVSGGPKNYAYRTVNAQAVDKMTVFKVRGSR